MTRRNGCGRRRGRRTGSGARRSPAKKEEGIREVDGCHAQRRVLRRLLALAVWLVVAVGSWITALADARGALSTVITETVGGEIGGWVRDALAVVSALDIAFIARDTVCGGATVSAVLADEIFEGCIADGCRRDRTGGWSCRRGNSRRDGPEAWRYNRNCCRSDRLKA